MPTIIFKATEKCNSNCTYCDVVARKAPRIMELSLLEQIFIKINDYLLQEPGQTINLIWHGGEPFLLGADYFGAAYRFQEQHCPTTKHRIEHAVQTNLTAVSQPVIDALMALGIRQVGTSYEPIPNIRGTGLKTNSEVYNRKFFEGLNLIRKNGFDWGFIYVVTKHSLEDPLGVFNFLTNLKLTGGFMMNPVLVYEPENSDIAITPKEYVDFLGAIMPVWWQHRQRYPEVDPFRSLLENLENNGQSLPCGESGHCAYGHLYIGPTGETSQCGRSGDWGILDYGNIKDQSLAQVLQNQQRDELMRRNELLPQGDCKDCRFWPICHGGCPLDAWHQHHDFSRKSAWCATRKVFIEKYFEPITGLKFTAEQFADQKPPSWVSEK